MTQAGSDIRRYRVDDVVDKGVFGTVYRADRDAAGERSPVLIQVLCEDLQRDIEHLKGLRRLHRALRAAASPALVHTEGPIELEGKLVVVSEHIEGLSLREVLAGEPERTVPLDIALGLVQQIAEALSAVHTSRDPRGRDILPVHRDVQPENVLLTVEGEVRLVGTGVALTGFDPQRMELHGGVAYLAPERLDNEESAAIDIYAATLTFIELVLGKLPKTVASRPSDHERRILEFDQALERLGHPVGVRAMVREGLAFDPARRPPAAVLERVCHALRGGIARQELAEWVRPRVIRQLRSRYTAPGEWSGRVIEEGNRRRGTIPPSEIGPRGTAPQLAPPRATQPDIQPVAPSEPPPGALETRWDPESLPEIAEAPSAGGSYVSFPEEQLQPTFGDSGFEEPVTMQRPPPPGTRLDDTGRPMAPPPGPGPMAPPPGVGGFTPFAPPESTDDPATVLRPSPSDIETFQRAPDRGRSPLSANVGLSRALEDADSPDPATLIRDSAEIFGGLERSGLPSGFDGSEDSDDPATMIRPEVGLDATQQFSSDFASEAAGGFPAPELDDLPPRPGNPVVSLVVGAVGLVFALGLVGGVTYGIANYTTWVFERDSLCESKVAVGRDFVEAIKVRPRRPAQRILDDLEKDCMDEKVSLFSTDLVVQEVLRRVDDGHLTEFEDHKIRDRLRKASE